MSSARRGSAATVEDLPNDRISPLFQAVAEATEEAVLNSLFKAESMDAHSGRIEALPVEPVVRSYRAAR